MSDRSIREVTPLGTIWGPSVEKKPAIPKTAAAHASGKKPGSDDPSREASDYSDEKQAEAHTYRLGKKGLEEDRPDNIGQNIDVSL